MVKIKDLTLNKIVPSKYPLIIGYFGCVHVMHQQLLTKYHHFNVFTFKDFYTKKDNLIYPFSKRISNLEKYKPINIYLFDLNSNNMKAEAFITEVLLKIQPSEIVVGSDFKFGSDHKGIDLLRKYFKVVTIPYNKHISTTNIVKLIKNNKLQHANDYLDEPYYYCSKWISGRRLGRKLGFRTVNLEVKSPILLKDGVFVSKITIGTKTYKGVTFLGTSETTYSNVRTLETHILDKKILSRTLYPSYIRNSVKVSFLKPIRKYKKFSSKEQLQHQIGLDKNAAINYFKENI